jgi:hypothetical protein
MRMLVLEADVTECIDKRERQGEGEEVGKGKISGCLSQTIDTLILLL